MEPGYVLKWFAIASGSDCVAVHFSGPHDSKEAAQTRLGAAVQQHVADGTGIAFCGVFNADFTAINPTVFTSAMQPAIAPAPTETDKPQ